MPEDPAKPPFQKGQRVRLVKDKNQPAREITKIGFARNVQKWVFSLKDDISCRAYYSDEIFLEAKP